MSWRIQSLANSRRARLLCLLIAGAVLRILLIWFPRPLDDDTSAFSELGTNLLRHGVYGFPKNGILVPSLIRLPGYPLFLGIFGGHFQLALLAQAAIDLTGCWLLSLFASRHISARAGELVFGLSALCIFTAASAATGLAESLSIFAVSLGIYAFGEWQYTQKNPARPNSRLLKTIFPLAAAAALAVLLRPDGILLFASILIAMLWYGRDRKRRTAAAALLFAALALAPLVPWTIRNWRVFHVVQPLAPEHANNPGELVNYGFIRWFCSWAVDFASTEDIYWNLNNDYLDIDDLPSRAFDSPAQYEATDDLLDQYNEHTKMPPALDARLNQLAAERIAAHPLRYYLWLPVLRVADMWLRPRTAEFSLDAKWWKWRAHPWQSAAAVSLGLLNLAYLLAALAGVATWRVPYLLLLISYVAMRCILLALIPNPEPRYTLEAYPIVILCAAAFLAGRSTRKTAVLPFRPAPAVAALPRAASYLREKIEESVNALPQLRLDLLPRAFEQVHRHMRRISVLQLDRSLAHAAYLFSRKQPHSVDQR